MHRSIGISARIALIALLATIPPVAARTETSRAGPVDCANAPESLGNFEPAESLEAPDGAVKVLRGGDEELTLASFRGHGVVLNFWATWCAPCVREMPALDALHTALDDAGIEVLAVSSDFGGAEVVRQFYEANQISHLSVLTDPQSNVAQSLGVVGLPTTVLFDPQGREIGRVVGAAEWDAAATVGFLRTCLAPRA